MKKRSARKSRIKTRSRKTPTYSYSQIAIFIPVILIALIGAYKGISKTHVLGTSVGPLLARDGSDDSGTSGGGGSNSGSGGTSGSGSTPSGGGGGSGSSSGGSGFSGTSGSNSVIQTTTPGSTKVDCIGPDGQHFTVDFHDCQELNLKWGRPNFSFTPLGPEVRPTPSQQEDNQNPHTGNVPKPSGKLEVQREGNKGQFNLETPNTHVEFHTEDDGEIHATAKKEDGTEVELESQDAVETLNSMLDDKNIEIGTTSAHNLAIRSGNVEAQTHFPLSVDPTTGELTVTTPAGSKIVTVLPDAAVQNLINKHVITDVESQAASSGAGLTTTQRANLTLLGTEPVFEINGVSNKHLLGIFPVGFSKTAFVSAENGNVVKVNQSLLNTLLEPLSF